MVLGGMNKFYSLVENLNISEVQNQIYSSLWYHNIMWVFRLKKASWCIGREWGSDRKKRLRDAVYPKDVAAESAVCNSEN